MLLFYRKIVHESDLLQYFGDSTSPGTGYFFFYEAVDFEPYSVIKSLMPDNWIHPSMNASSNADLANSCALPIIIDSEAVGTNPNNATGNPKSKNGADEQLASSGSAKFGLRLTIGGNNAFQKRPSLPSQSTEPKIEPPRGPLTAIESNGSSKEGNGWNWFSSIGKKDKSSNGKK